MAYVTSELVASEFKEITFSETTAITSDEVDEFIEQEEASLNGQVGTVYSVPVVEASSPISFAIMKMLATYLVRDRIEAILAVKSGGKVPDQGDGNETPWGKKAKEMIEKILKKDLLLPDASLLNSTGGVSSYGAANDLCPTFKKGDEQW